LDFKLAQESISNLLEKNLFFVFGYPKSGTTWLQHLLNGHPEIACVGESLFTRLMPLLESAADKYNKQVAEINEVRLQNKVYPKLTQDHVDSLLVTAIALMLGDMTNNTSVKCVGDKTPEYFKDSELFARLFPKAKFIHVIRDGRDVSISGWFQNLRLYGDKYRKRYPDLYSYINESAAYEWIEGIKEGRKFKQTHPNGYLELKYEDLHINPESTVMSMLRFLEVDPSDEMVQKCLDAGAFSKLSKGREKGEENRKSFFRKGTSGDWKNHYDQKCLDAFMHHAGDMIRELGYEEGF